ncbi:MAG: hypothetical protein R3284_00250 [Rubricoccaceae bacterium]|nr:hypothetical protein [Rubricoccaceae bacterium]
MFEQIKERQALRKASRAANTRAIVGTTHDVHQARVLVVMPDDETRARAAWRLILDVDTPRRNLLPVALDDRIAYAPDAFAGHVRLVTSKELDWWGLPKKDVAQEIWGHSPDVAIDFSHPFNIAAAYLCGASPAHFRIALHSEEAEPFYDFLLSPQHDLGTAYDAAKAYLEAIDPPVLAFK